MRLGGTGPKISRNRLATPLQSRLHLLGLWEKFSGPNPQLASGRVDRFSCPTQDHAIHRFRFIGLYRGHDPIRRGLFAGIPGDEPAGGAALVQFFAARLPKPLRAAGIELFVHPVVNPTGYADGTRANRSGRDLNREFGRGSHVQDL